MQARLSTLISELKSSQAKLEQRVEQLSADLAKQTGLRESADQQVAELSDRRIEQEAALVDQQQAQARLQEQPGAIRIELEQQRQNLAAEQVCLVTKTKEAEALTVDFAALLSQFDGKTAERQKLTQTLATPG